LQRVLGGHPDVQISAETWLMLHPLYARRASGLHAEYHAEWARVAVEEFLDHYTDGPEVYDNAIRVWAEVLYGNALQKGGKLFFLDKTPRYYYIIPDLQRVFPKAHFIFLLRNPMAVLASELNTYVKNNYPMLSLLRDDLLKAPELILDGIERLDRRGIQVRYESFVTAPETELNRICADLGISFVPEMLEYTKTPAPKGVMNDPVGIHRHSRPTAAGVDRWREMAADPQKRHFALSYLGQLGPVLLERFGYAYAEIEAALGGPAAATRPAGVFPWQLALQPKETWSLRQRMLVRRLELISKRGAARAYLASLRTGAGIVWRDVRRALRGSPA
jgi:hypothetical protein